MRPKNKKFSKNKDWHGKLQLLKKNRNVVRKKSANKENIDRLVSLPPLKKLNARKNNKIWLAKLLKPLLLKKNEFWKSRNVVKKLSSNRN